jgi:hypothetical protein
MCGILEMAALNSLLFVSSTSNDGDIYVRVNQRTFDYLKPQLERHRTASRHFNCFFHGISNPCVPIFCNYNYFRPPKALRIVNKILPATFRRARYKQWMDRLLALSVLLKTLNYCGGNRMRGDFHLADVFDVLLEHTRTDYNRLAACL